MLQRASTALIITVLAIASEGVLCALPCSAAMADATRDASPTGHCETNTGQPVADLTVAAAPGFCGDHTFTSSPSERASNRTAVRDASTLQSVSFSGDDRRRDVASSHLRSEVHGSPPSPSLTPPLRI